MREYGGRDVTVPNVTSLLLGRDVIILVIVYQYCRSHDKATIEEKINESRHGEEWETTRFHLKQVKLRLEQSAKAARRSPPHSVPDSSPLDLKSSAPTNGGPSGLTGSDRRQNFLCVPPEGDGLGQKWLTRPASDCADGGSGTELANRPACSPGVEMLARPDSSPGTGRLARPGFSPGTGRMARPDSSPGTGRLARPGFSPGADRMYRFGGETTNVYQIFPNDRVSVVWKLPTQCSWD